ncbi:MAG: sulfurtransferase-like selenium metabolism protein YedF [Candidatus Fimousia sp.]|uniref:sulfurtransferase-like selenium metabolism protein YedF n=1 Tax=Anaerostipes sp. 992a TaxID=1261637 RepID=UPI00095155A0|nr:sulfurtransferase-like selenium metabolism protein YedF [Anaerostipes sp. 992a]OLR58084.1 response regulator SirA [Anaerostipes sp. 992a]
MIEVNAMGKQCPLPVIETKKTIEELTQDDTVQVRVDNEIAVQNVMKMAKHKGLEASSQKISKDEFLVQIEVTGIGEKKAVEEGIQCQPDRRGNGTVVVLSSDCMGTGDESLGKQLMKGFVFALTKQDQLPAKVIMYNRGAFLSSENEDTIQDLKTLEAQGVEILTCGTCLNHYGLADKLAVGSVTNMYEIAESMTTATLIVKP